MAYWSSSDPSRLRDSRWFPLEGLSGLCKACIG